MGLLIEWTFALKVLIDMAKLPSHEVTVIYTLINLCVSLYLFQQQNYNSNIVLLSMFFFLKKKKEEEQGRNGQELTNCGTKV